jgi:phage gpG-like protein
MPDTFQLRWEIAGQVQLSRTFTRLAATLTDFRKPLRRMYKEVILPEIKEQFEAEGAPAWPELSPAYAARKARRHPGKPKLVVSGALMGSLTQKTARGAIFNLTKEQLEVGTDLTTPDGKWSLGRIHQEGAPRASVPARPMLRLRPEAQTRAVEIFAAWFYEEGRRLGVGL